MTVEKPSGGSRLVLSVPLTHIPSRHGTKLDLIIDKLVRYGFGTELQGKSLWRRGLVDILPALHTYSTRAMIGNPNSWTHRWLLITQLPAGLMSSIWCASRPCWPVRVAMIAMRDRHRFAAVTTLAIYVGSDEHVVVRVWHIGLYLEGVCSSLPRTKSVFPDPASRTMFPHIQIRHLYRLRGSQRTF
jgi:hypothetical protein